MKTLNNFFFYFLLLPVSLFSQTLDESFAGNGLKLIFENDEINTVQSTRDVKFLDNGKILALVTKDNDWLSYARMDYFNYTTSTSIVCLNSNGTFNTEFNGTGFIDLEDFVGECIYVLEDGKFLIGGATRINDQLILATVYAFNIDGTPDLRFSGSSHFTTINQFNNVLIKNLQVRGDGKIWAFGDFRNGSSGWDFIALRMNEDGTLDVGYDNNGIAVYNSSPGVANHLSGFIPINEESFVLYGTGYFDDPFAFTTLNANIAHFFDNSSQGSTVSSAYDETVFNYTSGYYYPFVGINDAIKIHDSLEFYVGHTVPYSSSVTPTLLISQPLLIRCETSTIGNVQLRSYFEEEFIDFPEEENVAHFDHVNRAVDGKLIITGSINQNSSVPNYSSIKPFIYKRLSDGSIDPSNPLPQILSLGFDRVIVNKVEMQPDGKLVFCGTAWNEEEELDFSRRFAFVSRIIDGCVASIELPASVSACDGETVTLNAGDFSSHQWSTGAITQSIDINNAGDYYVAVEDENGCIGGASVQVTFNNLPEQPAIIQNGNLLNASGEGTFEWFLNGNVIQGEIGNSIEINQLGVYTVSLTSDENCTSFSTPLEIQTLSLHLFQQNDIQVYPNPVKSHLWIKGLETDLNYQIIDLRGKIIRHGYQIQNPVNLSALPQGIYILRIFDVDGNNHFLQKLTIISE